MIGYSIGFGTIPFLLMGEILPAAQRSLLSSVAGSFNLGAMFVVIKTYHPFESVRTLDFWFYYECTFYVIQYTLLQLITTAGTFWLYSVLSALGVVFVIFCVPETKGRTTDEIAKLFEGRNIVPADDKTVKNLYKKSEQEWTIFE